MYVNANNFHLATYVFDISSLNNLYVHYSGHSEVVQHLSLEDSISLYDHVVTSCANDVILEYCNTALVVRQGHFHSSNLVVKDVGTIFRNYIRNAIDNAGVTIQEGCLYKFFVVGITLYMSTQMLTTPMRVRKLTTLTKKWN